MNFQIGDIIYRIERHGDIGVIVNITNNGYSVWWQDINELLDSHTTDYVNNNYSLLTDIFRGDIIK